MCEINEYSNLLLKIIVALNISHFETRYHEQLSIHSSLRFVQFNRNFNLHCTVLYCTVVEQIKRKEKEFF